MAKIPVGRTIAHAYKFAFRNFLTIIRVMWLAWAAMAGIMFLLRGDIAALTQASATRDFSQMQGHWGPLLLGYLVILVMLFMQIAGLTRLSLGLPMASRYYYFSLGKPVWRLIGAALLTIVAIAAVLIAYVLVIFVLGLAMRIFLHDQSSAFAKAIPGFLALLALLAGYCGVIFMTARFFFLLAPVVVAEETFNIGRAWLLTNRNFWRIFLIILSILLPFCVIEIAGIMALAGPMPLVPQGNTPEQLLAFRQAQQAWQISYQLKTQTYWYLIYPAWALLSVLVYGVSCAAQSFAYRTLTEGDASVPVAAD
ncbi:MAG TPA: hypothetical protein VHC39_00195 [Rhizomicrobium sp.]|nr:hypothetical protein [Rhizomicrobium sp.]